MRPLQLFMQSIQRPNEMTNDQVYAAGLLNKALDPATQPEAIRAFLRVEEEFVRERVPPGGRVVDLGCGTGRHLIGLLDVISLGVGIDYEWKYIAEANRLKPDGPLYFLVADATRVPLSSQFDTALCLTNTWGTMSDKLAVLGEMRRLAPERGRRLITVFASTSVEHRRQWYANFGHEVVEITDEHILTGGGLFSEHFTPDRLRNLIGDCEINAIGDVAYLVQA
jgi:SAM-dependent methyltransferase